MGGCKLKCTRYMYTRYISQPAVSLYFLSVAPTITTVPPTPNNSPPLSLSPCPISKYVPQHHLALLTWEVVWGRVVWKQTQGAQQTGRLEGVVWWPQVGSADEPVMQGEAWQSMVESGET